MRWVLLAYWFIKHRTAYPNAMFPGVNIPIRVQYIFFCLLLIALASVQLHSLNLALSHSLFKHVHKQRMYEASSRSLSSLTFPAQRTHKAVVDINNIFWRTHFSFGKNEGHVCQKTLSISTIASWVRRAGNGGEVEGSFANRLYMYTHKRYHSTSRGPERHRKSLGNYMYNPELASLTHDRKSLARCAMKVSPLPWQRCSNPHIGTDSWTDSPGISVGPKRFLKRFSIHGPKRIIPPPKETQPHIISHVVWMLFRKSVHTSVLCLTTRHSHCPSIAQVRTCYSGLVEGFAFRKVNIVFASGLAHFSGSWNEKRQYWDEIVTA